MPSKQVSDTMLAKNVEDLVHEIKENLCLKARPSHSHGRNSRPSPYPPCRSWSDTSSTTTNAFGHSTNLMTNAFAESTTTTQKCLQQQSAPVNNYNTAATTTTFNYKNRFGKKVDSTSDIDDPYELLQALLQSNNLVKEAVRRLQLNNGNVQTKRKSCYCYEDDDEQPSSRLICQLEL